MAENTSNTAEFNPALTFIITQAYRDMSVIDEEEQPTASMFNTALFALNAITKTLQATGIHVWTEEEAMIFLQTGVARYIFAGTGATNTAMCCYADDWTQFSLEGSYVAGTSQITLVLPDGALGSGPALGIEGGGIIGLEGGGELGIEFSYGVNVGDNIGIVLDANVMFWTTVQAIAGPVVTLTAPLPGSASSGNYVFDYPVTSQVLRPLQVPRARLYTYRNGLAGQGTITPMTRLSRQEYMDLPNQLQPGTPSQWFYSPQRGNGWLYFWLPAQQPAWGSRFTYYRSIQDWLVPNNTADFPQEWVQPLRWILAKDLAVGYSVPPQKWTIIKANYDESMDTVISWDRESEDVQFGMDWEHR
jgi:hypothetical protein